MVASRWIALLAYDGRIRHAAARRRQHTDAVRLASVHSRVIADLRHAIASDIEGFIAAADQGPGSVLTCRNANSPEGFVVLRLDESIGSRSLTVDLDEGTLRCHYDVTRQAPRAIFARRSLTFQIGIDGVAAASAWTDGVHCVFATVGLLGAFLLAPILGASGGVSPFVMSASSPAAVP
jgi:hypothetical protein